MYSAARAALSSRSASAMGAAASAAVIVEMCDQAIQAAAVGVSTVPVGYTSTTLTGRGCRREGGACAADWVATLLAASAEEEDVRVGLV